MKVARFVLKIVALSLTAAGVICAIIAYWDKLAELGDYAKTERGRLLCKEERRVRSNRFLLVFLFASTCLQTEIKMWINFLVFCLVSF